MYKIEATIKGLSPLRYNRYLVIERDGTNRKKMTHEQQIEDALKRSYRDEKGFYVPREALRACIINGGKKVKIGRGAASKLLEAVLIFEEEKYHLGTDKYQIVQGVVRIPPKTGARVTQYWVLIEEWSLTFSPVMLDDVFPVDGIKESIEAAGMYYGLLDGRPQLGRFELVNFKKLK